MTNCLNNFKLSTCTFSLTTPAQKPHSRSKQTLLAQMVWGQSAARGIEDLVSRIASNDPKLTSLTILKQRRFGHEVRRPLTLTAAMEAMIAKLEYAHARQSARLSGEAGSCRVIIRKAL